MDSKKRKNVKLIIKALIIKIQNAFDPCVRWRSIRLAGLWLLEFLNRMIEHCRGLCGQIPAGPGVLEVVASQAAAVLNHPV
jgi:hypothetical protein